MKKILTLCLNHITFLFFLIFVFIPLIIFFVVTIISTLVYNRYQDDKFVKNINEIEEHINSFLISTIFSESDTSSLKKTIKEFDKKYINNDDRLKKYVFEKIIHIKENINDIYEHRIILIYKYFKFDKLTNSLIRKSNWQDKSEAFYHYQSLDYKIKKGHIKKYLNSKNPQLKSNAIIAYISLSDEKFSYLDNFEYPISKADELKILNIIYKKKATMPKNIEQWLDNKNVSIVAIAIKLMMRYKHKLTNEQTYKLLQNEDKKVRKETIIASRELFNFEVSDILLNHYPKETSPTNKIILLQTLSEIGNENVVKHYNKKLKMRAILKSNLL
ncbi:MAG: hypothetical protein HC854_03170 [Flavobacterium sp.]|nr:hypothetical protein [Flavobacterium sp.]